MEKLAESLAHMASQYAGDDPNALREELTARRERVWHEACQLGRCRFANPPRHAGDVPENVDSTTHCGGYHGTRYVEMGTGVFWRWRPCARQRAWYAARAAIDSPPSPGR